jgi:predicted nucleic acid-binding protein
MAVFVDTGAWFAYFVRRDPDHAAATAWVRQNRQPLVTTDYVIDELLTLTKIRESYRVVFS